MHNLMIRGLSVLADTSGAISVMRDYIAPTMQVLVGIASLASVFFLVHGGYLYITSRGNPQSLEAAKRILRNALIGLVLVIGAATLTTILSSAYGNSVSTSNAALPSLQAIEPENVGSGLVEVLIRAITGFLNHIIQAAGAPFLSALGYFTKETPLMASNSGVFNLWLAIVGITDVLFILIVALLGFHVMSVASFGFDEIEFKHLLPRIGLVFLLINTSIFFIDAVIELSNVLITAVGKVTGASSVWETLTVVLKESGGQGVAALLVMLVFLIFTVILLIYYVGRLVVLFLGAVLSPLVIAMWLVPGFRDFSVSAIKTYVTTIFVLFVHVVTLMLAATLFTGMSATIGDSPMPNVLMSMVIGLATVLTLLKTQGVMMQFSYVSMGARNARKLGGQFMNGVSYLTSKGRTVMAGSGGAATMRRGSGQLHTTRIQSTSSKNAPTYKPPSGSRRSVSGSSGKMSNSVSKGTTTEAPRVVSRSEAAQQSSKQPPKNNQETKS